MTMDSHRERAEDASAVPPALRGGLRSTASEAVRGGEFLLLHVWGSRRFDLRYLSWGSSTGSSLGRQTPQ